MAANTAINSLFLLEKCEMTRSRLLVRSNCYKIACTTRYLATAESSRAQTGFQIFFRAGAIKRQKKGRDPFGHTAFRIVVAWELPLGKNPAGSEIQLAGHTPLGMTMRHWITSFA